MILFSLLQRGLLAFWHQATATLLFPSLSGLLFTASRTSKTLEHMQNPMKAFCRRARPRH
jgi:hypothetical protein